ncbi:Response regulator receiver domain-containing protein [Mariprofundus ferrinatatus]|uniref:Response regulator receiver domain-containing protein n=1 Tax=Mariprofundus ferrinatatus TaxID=1921087 RepID=A0A2K8L533_9PROT|nr:response regulator [Mariprofundus ferrinatatus]ATX81349.1 Response regulator receiver domain-containing protein [Mariprofundus ferrinatatus]
MRGTPLILTVDDEEIIHIILDKMIHHLGYCPIHASGVSHALRTIRELRPDVILLDIILPGGNCDEIIEAVRSTPELRNTGIILITHSEDHREIAKHIEAGADDFLLKPFNTTLFKARINNTLALISHRNMSAPRAASAG